MIISKSLQEFCLYSLAINKKEDREESKCIYSISQETVGVRLL